MLTSTDSQSATRLIHIYTYIYIYIYICIHTHSVCWIYSEPNFILTSVYKNIVKIGYTLKYEIVIKMLALLFFINCIT